MRAFRLILSPILLVSLILSSPTLTDSAFPRTVLNPSYTQALAIAPATAYSAMGPQGPARWPECHVITYDLGSVPATYRKPLLNALRTVSAASDIPVVPAISTTPAQLTFTYTPLSSFTAPDAWADTVNTYNTSGYYLYSHIDLRTDIPQKLLPNVFLHELGHAMGLGHRDDLTSVMYPSATGRTSYSPSDVALLRSMGPQHFCA